MSRIVNRAEAWERAYTSFNNINFSAFDYITIKESMVEYLKLYFPEDFSDFIESSEFIAILEIFAYVGEILAYRFDMNAHENFLSTAERKESVLRLAKLISYNPSRNIPARGLVKITSISTTETLFDSNGINLTNRNIRWNDTNNINWREQFTSVMNGVLDQDFGTVTPEERIQVDDVLFELYTWNNNQIANGVFPLSSVVSGESIPLELVPTALDSRGPTERRPERNAAFSLLYASDGLGDSSDTTGFLMFIKQGTMRRETLTFDGVTPNQTTDLTFTNINETDVWMNNVDPEDEYRIINDGVSATERSGEWEEVDLAHAQNIIFNTNPNRNKFETETLDNDQVRLVFGDGEFANIPGGVFDIWVRTSVDYDLVVPRNSIVDKSATFSYNGSDGNVQTLTFTYSLIGSLQNNAPSEDIEHIRQTAPAVYYSQDRMVNNRDYNTFMLQDPTILKLRALNRTYAGDSKFIPWHDPRESYENVKLFGDDLAIYFEESNLDIELSNVTNVGAVVTNQIEPLLSTTDYFTFVTSRGVPPNDVRRAFTTTERAEIISALDGAILAPPITIDIFYRIDMDVWITEPTPTAWVITTPYILNDVIEDGGQYFVCVVPNSLGNAPSGSSDWVEIFRFFSIFVETQTMWTIAYVTSRLIAESTDTRFWNSNNENRVITYETLNSNLDNIIALKANLGYDENGNPTILTTNLQFNILSQEIDDDGLINIHRLNVLPEDTNGNGLSNNVDLIADSGSGETNLLAPTPTSHNPLILPHIPDITNYVYFFRTDDQSPYVPIPTSPATATAWSMDNDPTTGLYKRAIGTFPLNFAWFHRTPQYNLIDPSSTNIIDMFIISRGYYTSVRNWLADRTDMLPELPTPFQLRSDYASLLDNKMISDTVVLHPGKVKVLFGNKAIPELRGTFKVIKSGNTPLTDNQIKVRITEIVTEYFDINRWEFGESFHATQLFAVIHNELANDIDSVVLVPQYANNQFGDLFQVQSREDEILQPHINIDVVEIVQSLNSQNLRQC